MRIPTVNIEGEDGNPVVINQDEFDASKHKLYGASDIVATALQPATTVQPAAPVATDANGNPVNAGDGGQMVPPAQTGQVDAASQPELLLVQKKGKKYMVVNLTGAVIEREGIEPDGYGSEQEALDAIKAVTTPAPAAGA